MKTSLSIFALVMLASVSTGSFAQKPCEELKQEIAVKLDAKGVQHYTLDVVTVTAVDVRKTVGTCDGGSQRIVYQRESRALAEVAKR